MKDAAPCGECKTTGGRTAPGRDVPTRIDGSRFGYEAELCHRCYNRCYARFRRNPSAYPETPLTKPKPEARPFVVDPLKHRGLIVPIALKYRNRGMDLDDLIGWGQVGLVKACQKYRPSRGFQFSTYATRAIRRAIRRAIYEQVPLVRIPNFLEKPIRSGQTTRDTPQQTKSLQAALEIRGRERLAEADEGIPLSDLAVAPEDRTLEQNEAAAQAERILAILPQNEATVLRLRFGVGCDPHTHRTAAAALGVSHETARTLEKRAMARARRQMGVAS